MKNNKSKKQANGGITLIALVITVIVMLILAGVAINLTVGENGIFKKSDEGAQIYKNAAKDEANNLNEADKTFGDLMNEVKNGIKVSSKKIPIFEGNRTSSVLILINVEGMSNDILSAEEGAKRFNEMLKTKTKEEKEQDWWKLFKEIIGTEELTPPLPNSLEEFLAMQQLESLEEFIINLVNGDNGNREIPVELRNYGYDEWIDVSWLRMLVDKFSFTDMPVSYEGYEVVLGEFDIMFRVKQYEILPPETVTREGEKEYGASENGEYEFIVRRLETGEDIREKVIVDEIDQMEYGEYEVLDGECIVGLGEISSKTCTTFEKAWVLWKGKTIDASHCIKAEDFYDYDVTEHLYDKSYNVGNSFNLVEFYGIKDEGIPRGDDIWVLIEKNGKIYAKKVKIDYPS